jgi:predicted N-acetyltransferase YhbS
MKNAIAIRPARSTDAPAISPLLRQLGYNQPPTVLAHRMADCLDALAFVAESNEQIVGFMSLHIIDWLHRPDAAARLSALIVDESHRRSGVGRALIALAETMAAQRGCTYIELTSNLRRRADGTYDFYDALGYGRAEDTTYFRKPLRAPTNNHRSVP